MPGFHCNCTLLVLRILGCFSKVLIAFTIGSMCSLEISQRLTLRPSTITVKIICGGEGWRWFFLQFLKLGIQNKMIRNFVNLTLKWGAGGKGGVN